MSFQVGSRHYIGFYTGSTGLTLSSFTINFFTVNGVTVGTSTSSSLAVVEVGSGFYYASYIPVVAGTYFLAMTSGSSRVVDCEDMQYLSVVNLTQNTGGANVLRPSLPPVHGALGTSLNQYLLMVFQSSDWKVGRTSNSYAVGMTQLDVSGNWISTPIVVTPGQSYTVLIRNNAGLTHVLQPNLEV